MTLPIPSTLPPLRSPEGRALVQDFYATGSDTHALLCAYLDLDPRTAGDVIARLPTVDQVWVAFRRGALAAARVAEARRGGSGPAAPQEDEEAPRPRGRVSRATASDDVAEVLKAADLRRALLTRAA